MQIILLADVEKLGNETEVVTVRDGYARNFLIPQGKAVVANKTNLANLKERLRQIDIRENKMLDTYREMAQKATAAPLQMVTKAGASGKIFGSISAAHIQSALKAQLGVEVEKKKIIMPEEVKELGSYTATLNLHKEVQAVVNFDVITEEATQEAAAEA
jgi:large subunit ribosomal protein L9